MKCANTTQKYTVNGLNAFPPLCASLDILYLFLEPFPELCGLFGILRSYFRLAKAGPWYKILHQMD
jgi:hypothetical protein